MTVRYLITASNTTYVCLHPPKANDLYHTSSPHLKLTGKEKARPAKETPGAAIWRLKQRGWVIPGDSLRGWPRIGMPGELLMMVMMMMMMMMT